MYRSAALPFVGADEPRYARVAQEMLQSGEWVIPHLEGQPWLEKPPLYFWITALVFWLLGAGEAQARLASAASLLAMVLTVYVYGRRWFSEQVAWIASAVLASSLAATAFARAASMDALFSLLMFLGLCAFADALLFAKRWAFAESVVSAACFGAAVLAKGLLGFLLPFGIIVIFLVWTETWRRLSWGQLLLWPLVALLVAVPWHVLAFQRAGFDFVATYLLNHHLARFFTELHHHAQPAYYYLGILLVGFFPWSLTLPLTFRRWGRQASEERSSAGNQALFLLRLTALTTLIFFSMSASKLPGYILPCFPVISLLIGVALKTWATERKDRSNTRAWLTVMLGLSLVVSGTTAPIYLQYRYELSLLQTLPLAAAFWAGVASLVALFISANRRLETHLSVVAGTMALFVFLLGHLCLGNIGPYHSSRDVALQAVKTMKPGDLLVSYRFFHHTLAYYSGYVYSGNWDNAGALRQGLATNSGKTLLVVTKPGYRQEIQTVLKDAEMAMEPLGNFGPQVLLRLTPAKTLQ